MTRNNGNGFRLPRSGGSHKPNTRPMPELADGGVWELRDTEATRSSAELRDAGGGGIMSVPLSDDSPGAALVRAHELGHARWTPRNLPRSIVDDFAFQLAEDCRVWQRLASSGVDCSVAIAPPSEWSDRIAEGPPRSYLLGVAVATAGTGDGANYREALRQAAAGAVDPKAAAEDVAELLRTADAIVDRMRQAGPWPTFADTLAAADCIREERPPQDPETEPDPETGEGEPGGEPGEGEGNGGSSAGEPGEPGEGNGGGGEPGEGEPGEGEGGGSEGDASEGNEGEGEGDASEGNGSPSGRPSGPLTAPPSGGGPRQAPRRPTGAERGAITRRLNQEKAEAEKARAEAEARDREAGAERLTIAEREAGERSAEDIRRALAYYDPREDEGEPGAMSIRPIRLPHRLPARMRGTAYRTATYGGRIGNAARVNIDGGIFRNRRMTRGGGTVLIDCSGSMSFTVADVEAILKAAPAVTIATYNGSGDSGELRIVAARGRRADASDLIPPYGGNIVDVPALEWLGRQPSRPRLWVSDGLVTAAGDCVSANVMRQAEAACRKYGIARVGNVSELLLLAEDPPR